MNALKEKVREYDRNRKNNNNMNETKCDKNCDVKSNSNGKNGKSKNDGKCDIKHDVKSNQKCEQDNNRSSWRCTVCRKKYVKKQAARELRKLTALKKKSNPKEIEVAVENIKKQIWCLKQVCQAMFQNKQGNIQAL